MQRVTAQHPCPICHGHDRMARGEGKRCFGFLSDDGDWAHCTRDDLAGGLTLSRADTYAHRLQGECRCGVQHGEGGTTHVVGESPRATIVATYDYQDKNGKLLYQVVRKHPKTFLQRRPDGKGGWIWNVNGVPRVPYRLPELLKTIDTEDPIFIVEGEKDADRLYRVGWPATCNSCGAGKWREEHSQYFHDAGDVRVIADRDEDGYRHAAQVAESLRKVGAKVTVFESPIGKDISDLLSDHGSVEDLVVIDPEEELKKLRADAAELRKPTPKTEVDNGPRENDDLETQLQTLASLSPIDYDRRREDAAQELKIRISTLDTEVAARRPNDGPANDKSGEPVLFEPLDPWPEPVDGGELLADLVGAIERFVVLESHAATAIALWILHAHAHDAAWISPILAFTSPVKRCGKTTALALLQRLVPRALPAANITSAALFRATEKWKPTLLVDEADSFLRDNDELRGVLNSGHHRATAQIIRTSGDDHEPRAFKTWAPKAIALIGSLPGTLEDRSIVIAMRRRCAGEIIHPLRGDRDHGFKDLARRCAQWVADHSSALADADPGLPPALNDRAADNWRPLVAIAEQLGEGAPARQAARALSSDEDEGSVGVLLLGDIRQVFADQAVERLSSQDLVEALVGLADRPWSEWRRGKPLSTNGLARLLRPFGIRPKTLRIDFTPAKGYDAGWFNDAFSRYLLTTPDPTVTPLQVNEDAGLAEDATVTRPGDVTDGKSKNLNEIATCSGVTDEGRPWGDSEVGEL